MPPILQESTLRRRTLRRRITRRMAVVGVLTAAVLAVVAVAALGSGDGSDVTPASVEAEAGHRGLDARLLAAVVEHDDVLLRHSGSESELRGAARRLRGGIDRHQSVVAALAASQVGDERVSRWLSDDPALATDPSAIPERGAREFVIAILTEVSPDGRPSVGTGR